MVDPVRRTLRCLYGAAAAHGVLGLALLGTFAIYGPYNAATVPARVMGIGLGVFLIGLGSGIQWVALAFRARRKWAWGAALGIFLLNLPTLLLLPIGVLGLRGLLAPETRDWAFKVAVPPPFRHRTPVNPSG